MALQVDVAPLEQQKERAGDDAGGQGAAQPDAGVGDEQVEQREHAPDDDHRGERREQSHEAVAAERERIAQVVAHGVGHDPEHRDEHQHGEVGGPLPGHRAARLHLPDVVEGALDRREDADHGPEEHHQRHGGHPAAPRAGQRLFGEADEVVDDLGVRREEFVEVVDQSVGRAEGLHHGEDHRGDGHQRHERVEGQRRRADDRAVLLQAARRVEKEPVLLHGPPHDGVAPLPDVAAEDRVGEVGEQVAEFHGAGALADKISDFNPIAQ